MARYAHNFTTDCLRYGFQQKKIYNIKLSFLDFRMWILSTYHMTQGNCAYMISTTWNLGKIEYVVFCIDLSENCLYFLSKICQHVLIYVPVLFRQNLMRLLLDGILNGFICNFAKQILHSKTKLTVFIKTPKVSIGNMKC